jgi:peptidoglycan/xylan/chitin deacetylase (PgdA/CDA1 family)
MKKLVSPHPVLDLILIITIIVMAVMLYVKSVRSTNDNVTYLVHTKKKVVALTFDDGPHPVFTPAILKILGKYKIKATFFMVGKQMEKYPAIVKQAIDAGNEIGNHTYTHPHNIEADTDAQMIRELDKCEQIIENMTGKRAHLFRPPRGLINGSVLTIANEEGYKTILWTVCADHHDAPTPEDMARRVMRRIKPGAIVLTHDGMTGMRWRDVPATEEIIRQLQAKGYKFVTISELLKLSSK